MPLESFDIPMEPLDAFGAAATSSAVGAADDMDYWLKVFMESGEVHQELPPI
jgi:myb proto-oncogene protein